VAELPNPYGPRELPRSQRQVVSDNSGELMGRAAVELGSGLAQVGAQAQQREDQFTYARARSALLQADLTSRQALEGDQDYETHEQRYSDAMSKARDDAAQLIRGPSDRALFQQESNLDIQRGTAAVRQSARGIEVDKAMADLSTLLDGNRSAALKAADEPTRAALIQNSIDAIGAARSQYGDHFTESAATKLRQQWTRDYAEGAIAMMPAGERVAALKGETRGARPDLADLQAKPGSPGTDASAWGKRVDGSNKGAGWLGVLRRPDGNVSTELSVGVNIDGKEREIPLLVPTLSRSEVQQVLASDKTPPAVLDKAVAFARQRIAAGQDPFASAAESPQTTKARSVADFLQPDERAKMLEAAQREDDETRLRGESQNASDSIMDKYNDRGEALAAARKIADPKLRDAVTQRVDSRFSEMKQIDDERRDNAFTNAATLVEKNGSVDGIDVRTWQTVLTPPQRQALEVRARQLREGEEPKTDLAVYYDLLQQTQADPNAFIKRNLMADRPSLSASDFQSLAHLQVAMRVKDGSADKLLTGVRTKQQVVDGVLREIGVKFGEGASPDQNKHANEFRYQVDQRVEALQKQTGKEATPDDVQKITDALIVQGTVPGTALGILPWSTTKRAYEVGPNDDFHVTNVNAVPAEDRRQIEAALKRKGLTVSNAAVLTLYNAKVEQSR
jgi:hypothetical protein